MKKIFLIKVKSIEDFFEKKIVFTSAAFLIVTSLLLIKLGNLLVDQTLWAEDGPIFISQSRELGAQSIWKEHAGYLNLYPRLSSYFASFFDIGLTPIIFLIFCGLSYTALVYVIINKGTLLKKSRLESLLLAILIIFQPHRDEVFFNITNAQWWIGSALCIFVLVYFNGQEKNSLFKSTIIFVASLTGPFSLFLLPLLAFNLVILRNWRDRKLVYIPVLLGAFIQLIFVLNSQRIYSGEWIFEDQLQHLLTGIKTLIFFGSDLKLLRFFSIILWIMILSQLIRVGINFVKKNKNNAQNIQAILLLFAAAFYYASPIFLLMAPAEILSPLGSGARYFFITYSLIFFAAWLLFSNNKVLRITVLSIILLIDCLSNPFKWAEDRVNHQFQSYVEFSKYNKDVVIKNNPYAIPDALHWKIILPNRELKKISGEMGFDLSWKKDEVSANLGHRTFFVELFEKCNDSKHIGIELKTNSTKSGVLQLAWGNEEIFLTKNFLDEQFFSGESKIYFALPSSKAKHLLLKSSKVEDDFEIKSTKLYCL